MGLGLVSDGKILLSSEGLVFDFSVSLESILGIPSVEIYGKLLSEFIEFENFETKTAALIYGDFRRFSAEPTNADPELQMNRTGWIKTKSGRFPARFETTSALYNNRPAVALFFYVTGSSSLIPDGLPGSLGPVSKLILNLWQHERVLLLLILTAITVYFSVMLFLKHKPTPTSLPTPVKTLPKNAQR
jgi:PAS domain-containing protein